MSRRTCAVVLAVLSCVAALVAPLAGPASAQGPLFPQAENVGFDTMNPARLLDTRPGGATIDGAFAGGGALGAGSTVELTVLGRAGLAATGVTTVVLNVTVNEPTAAGYLTVWPTGSAQPNASNLNFTPGRTVPNLVMARVGSGGKVSIFNSAGATHLIADIVGFANANGVESIVPARILDTRLGGATVDGAQARTGVLGSAVERELPVLGRGGVPASGVDAVVLNVTVNEPTASGFLTVWPNGATRPNASNLNFAPGVTVPNLVVAKVGSGGAVRLFNSRGDTNVIADVVGYFTTAAGMEALVPARLLDTRPGTTTIDGIAAGTGPLGANSSATLTVTGRGGVPATGVGTVWLNVTVTNPTAAGYLTVWPNGEARPNASNLNFTPGLTVPNLVAASVGYGGRVAFYNSAGLTDLVVDVVGWLPSTDYLGLDTFELPPGIVGTPYAHNLGAFGGDAPYVWGGSSLQPGLGLDGVTGALSGTPTTAGTVSTPLRVTDSFGRIFQDNVGHTVFPASAGYVPVEPTTVLNLSYPSADSTSNFSVTGVAGVPTDARGVVLMVFTASLTSGYTTVYPAGTSRPFAASTVNPGGIDTNLVVLQPGVSGTASLYSSSRTVGTVVQVLGYFGAASLYQSISPFRILDTRLSNGRLASGTSVTVSANAPSGATAVMVNLTAADPSSPGTMNVWSGAIASTLPSMRWDAPGTTRARFALVPLVDGVITVRPDGASTHVIVDVLGYIAPAIPS